ncbi:MAG: hypothetical protein PHY43_04200 [Verrucomicrobiales bacterium]|nr:hypothetical protein [Verrucomicrobiales bacterium]
MIFENGAEKCCGDLWTVAPGCVASSVIMSAPMPLLVFFFAVAMGVNHRQGKNNQTANSQDDDNWLILPYLANKFGNVRIHNSEATPRRPKMEMAIRVGGVSF